MSENIKINGVVDFKNYTTPSWDVWFMKQVYLIAEKSKDPSTKIGAILVKDNRILSSGYNGFAIGVKDLPERYDNRELKYKLVVHAEANAILSAARFGISTLNSILYTQALPCHDCTKSVIQGGIKEIVLHSLWPKMTSSGDGSHWNESHKISLMMLEETGINIRLFTDTLGLKAYVNGKIYSV